MKKCSRKKESNKLIQIKPKWKWHKKSSEKPIIEGVTTIYDQNGEIKIIINIYIYKTNRVKFVDKTFLEKVSRLCFFISQSENKDINLSFGLHLKGFTHKPCHLPLQD